MNKRPRVQFLTTQGFCCTCLRKDTGGNLFPGIFGLGTHNPVTLSRRPYQTTRPPTPCEFKVTFSKEFAAYQSTLDGYCHLCFPSLTGPFITKLLSSVQTFPNHLHHNNFCDPRLFYNKQIIILSLFLAFLKPFLALCYRQ